MSQYDIGGMDPHLQMTQMSHPGFAALGPSASTNEYDMDYKELKMKF